MLVLKYESNVLVLAIIFSLHSAVNTHPKASEDMKITARSITYHLNWIPLLHTQ